ncbi:hypothetical protein FEZ32_07445 [Acidipropionibacterium jensenii]|uniref:hypothetical protein n=1 Tax=Acidipropionibacterium jensenii TaxID=1749 RepID=UPI00110C026A|nr:hypothetical protein [Acidipropionibacterium jensenii]QCV88209.1 hypothetical protein FEZ32_07445 [Acidipropionibacterium jensenii]
MSSTRNEAPGQSAGGPRRSPSHDSHDTSYREVLGQIDTPAQDGPDRLIDFLDLLNWSALRLLQDALIDGDAHYWQRRAQQFEDARRKPGEYLGRTTPEERDLRDRALVETAEACRAKAAFVELYGDPELTGAASIVLAGLMNDHRQEAAA